MAKYLDYDGLKELWSKIKDYVAKNAGGETIDEDVNFYIRVRNIYENAYENAFTDSSLPNPCTDDTLTNIALSSGSSNKNYAYDVKIIGGSNLTSGENMFNGCSKLKTIPDFTTSNMTTMSNMFNGCSSITTIPELDTSKVTNMSSMFSGCSKLTNIPSTLNTSNVTTMSNMFQGCSRLTELPALSTSKVTNMENMFNGCSSLTSLAGVISDYSNCNSMHGTFKDCKSLVYLADEMSLLSFSKVTDWGECFMGCTSLTSFSALDAGKPCVIDAMFSGCKNLEEVRTLDTSSVGLGQASSVSWDSVFDGCSSLTYIPKLVMTSYIESMDSTFSGCSSLESIDTTEWDCSSLNYPRTAFDGCKKLSSLIGTHTLEEVEAGTVVAMKNWGKSFPDNTYLLDFSDCPLERASVLALINGYVYSNGGYLELSNYSYSLLTASDKTIADSKRLEIKNSGK